MEFKIENIMFEEFKKFFANKTGQILSKYNKKFIILHIRERLAKLGINSFREYFEKLIVDKEIDSELDELFYLIINKESDFFRYPDQFLFLDEYLMPELILKAHQKDEEIKIASIGFARGQEIYSIAMILKEHEQLLKDVRIKLEGFDILKKNINFARKGIYNTQLLRYFLNNNQPEFYNLFKKYFISLNEDEYTISDDIREMVTLRRFNLKQDNLYERYDIIFCRNVIIYFDENDKKRAIRKLYNSLKEDGYLFLGHSEYPVGLRDKFKPIFYRNTIVYKKIESSDINKGYYAQGD